ncbi:CotH kinase family protein [Klebsiella pneumoniae]
MPDIIETGRWSEKIPLISRSDRVEGGRSGLVNIQTEILADRTQYLRKQLDETNGLLKSGELPFSGEADAVAAIAAGKIPEGALFSIRSDDPAVWVEEYRNQSGEPVSTGKKILSSKAVTLTVFPTDADPDGTIAGIDATTTGQAFVVIRDNKEFLYRNDNGTALSISESVSTDEFDAVKDAMQKILLSCHIIAEALGGLDGDSQSVRDAVLNLHVSQQVLSCAVNELGGLPEAVQGLQLNALMAVSTLGSALTPLEGFEPGSSDDGDSDTSQRLLNNLYNLSMLAGALVPLDGFDPDAISVEARETYSEQYTFPKPGNIIKLFVTSPSGIPTSKGAGEYYTTATIDIDGEILNIPHSSISVQGDSSAAYPKKNLNIGLYIDDKYDDSFTLKIGDCLPHDEWVFKANWIDHTNLRNLMSYHLWERMMASRDGWPKRDIDNYYVGKTGLDEMDTRATGYPVGYPCVMYINGDFYGIGALAIGKKRENYNIPKNKAEQIMIVMGGWKPITSMYDNAHVTGSDTIEIKAPKTVSEETLGYLQTWDAFANLAQADFTQQAPEHLDTRNVVDFYLLLAAVGATDLFAGDKAKNAIFYTWDGTKWYFGPYDLDTTYGLHFNGTQISYAADSAPKTDSGTFWKKILVTYADELAARYAELRDKDIFSVNCLYDIAAGLSSKYTHELDKAEINKWPTKPSLTVTSRDQIFGWFNDRLAYLDNKFNYTR